MISNSTKKVSVNHLESENKIGQSFMELLNAVENAILSYYRKYPDITNPYQFFSSYLGYKSKNFLYGIFTNREHHKLTVEAVLKIYEKTKDETLKTVWSNYLETK